MAGRWGKGRGTTPAESKWGKDGAPPSMRLKRIRRAHRPVRELAGINSATDARPTLRTRRLLLALDVEALEWRANTRRNRSAITQSPRRHHNQIQLRLSRRKQKEKESLACRRSSGERGRERETRYGLPLTFCQNSSSNSTIK